MNKIDIFRKIFKEYKYKDDILQIEESAKVNFALIKYWGKENEDLMIPMTSSIAFQVEDFYGTKIKIYKNDYDKDVLIINNVSLSSNSSVFVRFYNFFKIFKKINKKFGENFFTIEATSNIPIAAGLASSASFFATLTRALFNLHIKIDDNLYEEKVHQSIIARMGSVSASRSIFNLKQNEFVILNKYKENSFSCKIKHSFNNLYCGIILLNEEEKKLKSSDAMKISIQNSHYKKWVQQTNEDFTNIKHAIHTMDIKTFFEIIMNNSEMLCNLLKKDNICYDLPMTIDVKNVIKDCLKNNNLITFTQDAGPNIKVISNNKDLIEDLFKKHKIIISKIM